MDVDELARRISMYLKLDLPDGQIEPNEAGSKLAARLWRLIRELQSGKQMGRVLWEELRDKHPDVAAEISFAESGAPEPEE